MRIMLIAIAMGDLKDDRDIPFLTPEITKSVRSIFLFVCDTLINNHIIITNPNHEHHNHP